MPKDVSGTEESLQERLRRQSNEYYEELQHRKREVVNHINGFLPDVVEVQREYILELEERIKELEKELEARNG